MYSRVRPFISLHMEGHSCRKDIKAQSTSPHKHNAAQWYVKNSWTHQRLMCWHAPASPQQAAEKQSHTQSSMPDPCYLCVHMLHHAYALMQASVWFQVLTRIWDAPKPRHIELSGALEHSPSCRPLAPEVQFLSYCTHHLSPYNIVRANKLVPSEG